MENDLVKSKALTNLVQLLCLSPKQNNMKRKFEFVIGLLALTEVIYKIITCPSCEDNLLMFQVPGFVHILFWGIGATMIFYNVYKANWAKKEEGQNS